MNMRENVSLKTKPTQKCTQFFDEIDGHVRRPLSRVRGDLTSHPLTPKESYRKGTFKNRHNWQLLNQSSSLTGQVKSVANCALRVV